MLAAPAFPGLSVLMYENLPIPRQNAQIEDESPGHLACSLAQILAPTPNVFAFREKET